MRARDVVSWAKKNGFTLKSGAVGTENVGCARAAIMTAKLGVKHPVKHERAIWGLYNPDDVKRAGYTERAMNSIEAGFEKEFNPHQDWEHSSYSPKYVRLGRNIAKLIKS